MRLHPLLIVSALLLPVLHTCAQQQSFAWFSGKQNISYAVNVSDAPVIQVALEMFKEDLRAVTGVETVLRDEKKATVCILQYTNKLHKKLKEAGIPVDSLAQTPEAFFIKVHKNRLLVVGSDPRGTAYGILELSRMAGVSPWVWWGDVVPEKKDELRLAVDFKTFQSPSVAYRGIFLNDEDWSLQPWSWKHFDPQGKEGLISAKTYKEIFKLMMRLRANTIWPGMHGVTVPFYLVPGAKEAANECGIVVGSSHCEPLMRNNVGEWDVKQRGNFNFIDNHDAVINYWTERLKEVNRFENFYTIGMRGVHDGEMEGVHTMEEKTIALQKVINEQRLLLKEYSGKDLTKIPQQFVPYKEVLAIYENGLQVPDDVTLTWCDDNYGYMTRLSNPEQQKRSGGSGVYYHLSYWGRPHDYLWLTTTQPGLIYNEMREAYNHNARRLWIVNVHDLKPAAYDLELFLDLAWNIHSVSPTTINNHQENWLKRDFGSIAGQKLFPAMLEFYRLCAIRRPEFMGWSRVEEDKKIYPKGWTPVVRSEFSLTEFGNELSRYLQDYEAVKQIVNDAEKCVPANRKDAFFATIKYPVFGAAAMAEKWLEAQRATTLSEQIPKTEWNKSTALVNAVSASKNAYKEILDLTDHYNNIMSGGKWKYSMCYNPRNLYVFEAPKLPEVAASATTVANEQKSVATVLPEPEGVVVRNAKDFTSAGNGYEIIQALGHSMNAVSLPKGGTLVYEFECDFQGDAVLRTAVIPTQPNDTGDIRFSVQIDDEQPRICSYKEGFRTDSWKKNVLRGQAIRETLHSVKKGRHTLTITALDNHVLVDQWMLDSNTSRVFYVFPVPVNK